MGWDGFGEPQHFHVGHVLKEGDFKDMTTKPLLKHIKLMADRFGSGQVSQPYMRLGRIYAP